jgi:hypothetical protein
MFKKDSENYASGWRGWDKEGGRSGCEWYDTAAINVVETDFGIRQCERTIFPRFYKQYSCTFRVNETAERIEQPLNQPLTTIQPLNQPLTNQTSIYPTANEPNNNGTNP